MNGVGTSLGRVGARSRRRAAWAQLAALSATAVAAVVATTAVLADGGGRKKETIELDEARIFLEENATDGDLGIHMFWDGDAWTEMTVRDEDGRTIFKTTNKGSLKEIGSTEVLTESEEPGFDELPREDFLELFPEGEYEFVGRTVDGGRLVGTAVLSHAQPGGPVIANPSEDEEVDPSDFVVTWETVTDPEGDGNEITGYEVVVEQEDPLRIFSIHMPATATSVTVPPEFLAAGKDSKVEILAISANGNRTATEVPFVVPQ